MVIVISSFMPRKALFPLRYLFFLYWESLFPTFNVFIELLIAEENQNCCLETLWSHFLSLHVSVRVLWTSMLIHIITCVDTLVCLETEGQRWVSSLIVLHPTHLSSLFVESGTTQLAPGIHCLYRPSTGIQAGSHNPPQHLLKFCIWIPFLILACLEFYPLDQFSSPEASVLLQGRLLSWYSSAFIHTISTFLIQRENSHGIQWMCYPGQTDR